MQYHFWANLALVCSSYANELNFPFPDSSFAVDYHISVNRSFMDVVLKKVNLYRSSIDLHDNSNSDGIEGIPQANMSALARFWAEEYDWTKTQDRINAQFSHYAINADGGPVFNHSLAVHFVHERSTDERAIPLLILHGWPSTLLEWSQVIKPLTSSVVPTDQNFHVVAPDLPGFGFSPAPEVSGLGPREMGYVFDDLMNKLGYSKYGIISTDLGWWVGMWMASELPSSILGHFSDFFVGVPMENDLERFAGNDTTPDEASYMSAVQAVMTKHSGYSTVQTLSPLAIGQAMSDSPVGFAGWIWHLLNTVSDGYQYTYNEIIDRTLLLYIPGAWANLRAYREFMSPKGSSFQPNRVPTGVTLWGMPNGPFPELANATFVPRDWMKRMVNLVYTSKHDAGGHFPAQNNPQDWIRDVREFFGIVRSASNATEGTIGIPQIFGTLINSI